MKGIENISRSIVDEAKAKAEKILEEARQQAARIGEKAAQQTQMQEESLKKRHRPGRRNCFAAANAPLFWKTRKACLQPGGSRSKKPMIWLSGGFCPWRKGITALFW